ncbi:Diguanylate cyclase (GGDEF)-like protein [Alteromonas sp. 38]|uniref:tetratricopeptide repeat-containing diguanylate cyclase n=1 Tax=Alteromonas TaxID=226 RepID=UPI0012F17C57|nr:MULTISPECIES: tetratricopeptide repeat-containing diguanylate cyclase [Alteromonas]CAD5255505.1 Diguanylate cyclase (GGDEF)-like protein [Alteromonas sp. 154]VXA98651.1 Diguanylate cyclase (GGDEF)-like protein [Alteromonas sp. 38]
MAVVHRRTCLLILFAALGLLVSLSIPVSATTSASVSDTTLGTISENALPHFEEAIFLHPQQTYRKLATLAQSNNFSDEGKVWLLLRKAQSESVLALYKEMDATLVAVAPFADVMTNEQNALWYYLRGSRLHLKGNISGAIDALKYAVEVAKEDTNSTVYVLAIRELGYVFALSGDYYRATLILQDAYKNLVILNNQFFNGLLEESLGDTYNYLGNYTKAIEYYEGALVFFESIGYQPLVASTLLGLAIVNRKLENWNDALSYFDRYEIALDFSSEHGEKFYLHYGRAMTLAEKGECNVAISAIDNALSLSGPIDYYAELYKKRALCNLALDNLAAAKQDLSKARTIFNGLKALHNTQWHLELDYIAGLVAFKDHRFEQAFELIHRYYKDFLELQRLNNSEYVTQVQATMEAERKDKEIALLRQQTQLQAATAREQSLKVRQKNMMLVGVVVIFALLLIFVVFQYKNSRKLLALSIRDDLTGLHNRRYFFDYFEHNLVNLSPNHVGLALISFDIDNFKHINDNLGHHVGDEVIKTVAQTAANTLRTNDVIARIGGDEFIIALPRTTLLQAKEIAKRILENIRSHRFTTKEGADFSVTASLGVAYHHQNKLIALDVKSLMESADTALYQSKRAGKNRFTVAA